MDGLSIYIAPEEITVRNERVHITFYRHYPDSTGDNTPMARCLQGTDIPRLFDAINALNALSILPPGNEHRGNPSGENTIAALQDDDKEPENGRRRQPARNR